MRRLLGLILCGAVSLSAGANVYISEIFINPPGSLDDTREFIELTGTPGKKLDGYGLANLNGALTRFYPLGSIPPRPEAQEIDEFFSLDGLELGPNGILVIGVGLNSQYPTLLPDANFQRWNTIWNGFRDTPGKLENDGSLTILLVRHRPGATQQTDPTPPVDDLRWGKDVKHDEELLTPVIDPQDGLEYDQYGSGSIDVATDDGTGGLTLDLRGESTPDEVSDDLEVVDEVSFENERGWEYDVDGRLADLGSPVGGLPERRVHALDDPQGFNPDCLTRVDYRKTGDGWTPVGGAVGEMPNGNNWQDTATEQWIRGETVVGSGGQGGAPQMFYSNEDNTNPDAIQPFVTNVPLWLDDGSGEDYDFTPPYTYQVMAGRVNPLAVNYIPGDANRDGRADAEDIALIASVFGDDDWIFSNSFAQAPQGNSGDPATQTRPWDLDQTGDNGIEASDLQWALNFQGDTTGRIVGRRYDSTDPPTSGVHLNPASAVTCQVSTTMSRDLENLVPGQTAEITVRGRLTAGAIVVPGQQNGIMQYIHDVDIADGGVIAVVAVEPLGAFSTTRSDLQIPVGQDGERGVATVNGYTTEFSQGLPAEAELYRVTIRAIGVGTTTLTIRAAGMPEFALSTPSGLKIGHADAQGNPGAALYPAPLNVGVGGGFPAGDLNCDGSVDGADIDPFFLALGDPGLYGQQYPHCDFMNADMNGDDSVDGADIDAFFICLGGGDCP